MSDDADARHYRRCLLLSYVIRDIERYDTDYGRRAVLVLKAIALAREAGFAAGFRIDPAEPGWLVAYIELPAGQVSWHMPQHERPWDGHTTEQKYARIRDWVASLPPLVDIALPDPYA